MAMEDPHATARSMMQAFEAKQAPDPVPGTISAEEARRRSWYPHPQQFRWPYPKDPESFREHPKVREYMKEQ